MARACYFPTLIIFARTPRMGQVKTRLAKGIGVAAATRFYRSNLDSLLRRQRSAARWRTQLWVSNRSSAWHPWPSHPSLRVQSSGDIGHRMFDALKCAPLGPVVLVGSDIPSITPNHIAHAFKALSQSPLVFGPSEDGGFWLVGISVPPYRRAALLKCVLEGVRWSSAQTLSDVMRNLSADKQPALIDVLADVDCADDYVAMFNAPKGVA